MIERIALAIDPKPDECLLEIGAGTGQLTLPLIRLGARITAIEAERLLMAELRRAVPRESKQRVELIVQDALQVDFRAFHCPSEPPGLKARVCGNLPYSVAAPILLRLLSARAGFVDFTLMFQDEVAERLAAKPGTKAYGFLTVIAQQAADVQILFRISPQAFKPRPRVVSALVHFKIRSDAPDVGDEGVFRWLVKSLLAHRRKTIANNIKRLQTATLSPEVLRRGLEHLSLDPARRAETLTVDEFAALSRFCASLL